MNQTFQVTGMTCGHCEMAVKKAITALDPQAQVSVDRSSGKVDVVSQQPRQAIMQVIAQEGYEVH